MLLAPIIVTIQVTAMNEVYKVGENKGRRGGLTKSARNKSHEGKQSCDESPVLHELMRPSKKHILRARLADGEILTDG